MTAWSIIECDQCGHQADWDLRLTVITRPTHRARCPVCEQSVRWRMHPHNCACTADHRPVAS